MSMNADGNFSVIICAYTWERWNDVLEAVASVQAQTLQPREIIVVIDHNPELQEALAQQLGAGVRLMANAESRGLSGARNTGIGAASGEWIAFLDDDAVAEADWLARLANCFDDAAVMGAGGAIEPLWIGGEPAWFPREFNWVVGCTYTGMPESRSAIRNLLGCNMAFRREVFEAIGGFRSGMGRIGKTPLGCEETELCIRAMQRWPERSFVFEPAARVHHRVPAVRGRWEYFHARCYAEGLSKAQVASLVGPQQGLESERRYVRQTLPAAVLGGMGQALRGDVDGPRRAAAVAAGLAWTVAGYMRGKVRTLRASAPSTLGCHANAAVATAIQ